MSDDLSKALSKEDREYKSKNGISSEDSDPMRSVDFDEPDRTFPPTNVGESANSGQSDETEAKKSSTEKPADPLEEKSEPVRDDFQEKFQEYFKGMAETLATKTVPAWMVLDAQNLCGKIDRFPTREEIDVPIAEHLIVELYSK